MRLIDADALKESMGTPKDHVDEMINKVISDFIDNAPTVEVDEMTQDLINKVNVNIGLAKPIKDERGIING